MKKCQHKNHKTLYNFIFHRMLNILEIKNHMDAHILFLEYEIVNQSPSASLPTMLFDSYYFN